MNKLKTTPPRKIFLITPDDGDKIAFQSKNALLNSFDMENMFEIRELFRKVNPYEKTGFVKEIFYYDKLKITIETVQFVGAKRLKGYI